MDSDPKQPLLGVSLNANQRRHYGILIAGVDTTLGKIEGMLAAAPSAGLAQPLPDLPASFQTDAPPILARVRQALRRLALGLELEIHPMSQRQTCRALLRSEINRIEESYSTQLRGYGAVDESLGKVLDPLLRDVRSDLGALVALLPAKSTPAA